MNDKTLNAVLHPDRWSFRRLLLSGFVVGRLYGDDDDNNPASGFCSINSSVSGRNFFIFVGTTVHL